MLPGYDSTKSKLYSNPIGGFGRCVGTKQTAFPCVWRHQNTQILGAYLQSQPGLVNTYGRSTNKPAHTLTYQMYSTVNAMIPFLASIQSQQSYTSLQEHTSEPTYIHQQISTNSGMALNPASTLNQQVCPTAITNSYSVITDNLSAPAPLQRQLFKNHVDSWIADLHGNRTTAAAQGIPPDITMAWLIQQSLQWVKILVFDGSTQSWVEFITKFQDPTHNQPYLDDNQRHIYLLQHLTGKAKCPVQGFADDVQGCVRSPKRLKLMFGRWSRIAQATLSKVTRGKQIQDSDHNGLVEFFFTISDCLVTIRMLNYASDLYSVDILRQAVRRLPRRLHNKWAEFSLRIRSRNEEPNLIHLESWHRKMHIYHRMIHNRSRRIQQMSTNVMVNRRLTTNSLEQHKQIKWGVFCAKVNTVFGNVKDSRICADKKFEEVKKLKLCSNCLTAGHIASKCSSRYKCFVKGCGAIHHTILHDHFVVKRDIKDPGDGKNHVDTMKKSPDNKYDWIITSSVSPGRACTAHCSRWEDLLHQCSPWQWQSDYSSKSRCFQEVEADGEKRNLNVTTIKDKAERFVVQDVSLRIASRDSTVKIKVESVFVVPSNKFNMPSDFHDTDMYTPGWYTTWCCWNKGHLDPS